MVNDLLVDLQKEGLQAYGDGDDIAIIVSGYFLATVSDLMENFLKILSTWCKTKGLTVNLFFTRKYKCEPIEPLMLKGNEIVFTTTVKYLGVLLNLKLYWTQHPTDRRKKFYSCLWVCRRAMGKT
jgi:hypothetical protein